VCCCYGELTITTVVVMVVVVVVWQRQWCCCDVTVGATPWLRRAGGPGPGRWRSRHGTERGPATEEAEGVVGSEGARFEHKGEEGDGVAL